MKVFVINIEGKPLMPCSPRTARLLLKSGNARVFRRVPFTIKMTRKTGHYVQPVTLGVDPGYRHIGLSASTKKEELYASEIELRNDISEKLATRRKWRRTRRNRLRYRAPRFNNRKKPEGWLCPSVRSRLDAHIHHIKKICEILPVSMIVLETAAFDIQKIKNPEISGTGYQNGEQAGFWNAREYIFWRDGHKCRHCHGKSKDPILNVHHIESRKIGGNAPNNLISLCETCHKAYHAGKINLDIKRGKSFKPETFIGIMRWFLWDRLKSLGILLKTTFGYLTKMARISHNIVKSHCADAFCIAGNLEAKRLDSHLFFKQVRKRGRQVNKANIAKDGKWIAKKTNYIVHGFRRFDKVMYKGIECFVWGLRKSGSFLLKTLKGETVGNPSWKKLRLLYISGNWLVEERHGGGVSSPI